MGFPGISESGILAMRPAPLFLVVLVAWAPFPIGSNHPWSWTLLAIAVALNWALVVFSGVQRPGEVFPRRWYNLNVKDDD